jgi:hypothetical protein
MGNAVATRSRTELAQESAYDPFAMAGDDMAGGNSVYAKFNGNSGEFTYGSAATEIDQNERMAANVAGARRGFICWKESEVVEEIMVQIIQGPPPLENTLTDHGPYQKNADGSEDGWSAQFAIDFRLLGEDHDGIEITYKTSTKSAMRPLGDLVKQYSREYKNNPGCVPIVEFSKGSYMPKDKKIGKKFYPVFKIVEWIPEDELEATYGDSSKVNEGDDNENLIEAPKAEVKKPAAKPAAAAKPKAEKPAEKPPVKETAPAKQEPAADETRALSKAEILAAKKAALEAEMAALEADEGGEEAVEEDGSAEDGADETPAVQEEKPVPTESRSRRRSF